MQELYPLARETKKQSSLVKLFFLATFHILSIISITSTKTLAQCDVNRKYDKIVSSFHTSIALSDNGEYLTWGEKAANNGSSHVAPPLVLNSTNYPALTGTVKFVSLGSNSVNTGQFIALTTTGLFAWGTEGTVLDNALTTSSTFALIQTPTGGDASTKLPTGVSPSDVTMIHVMYKTLAIVASGNVWVLTQADANLQGNAATQAKTTWHKVKIDANNDLANVTVLRGMVSTTANKSALMALTSTGKVYTWGASTFLGNGTPVTAKNYATEMTLPAEFNSSNIPKFIGVTGGASINNSLYVLSNSGSLYGVGDNSKKQLGDWTTTDRTSWVKAQKSATAGDYFTNINFLSVQEHDANYAGVAIITTDTYLYSWGDNNNAMLGRLTAGSTYDPGFPEGFTAGTDKAIFAEMGGHTLVYVKEGNTKFCYVGHRINGSMGESTSSSGTVTTFDCANTPTINLCGAVTTVADPTKSTISATPTSILANGITTSTITIQLKTSAGVNLTRTGGTVIVTTTAGTLGFVTDNDNGTYTVILTSGNSVATATLGFSVNGTTASGISSTTTVSFYSTPPPSALSYTTPNVYTVGSTITNLNPTVTGTVTSYSISPGLPTGLSFNTTTGVISGTPTVTSPATDYTVTATNGTGSTTAVVRITVNVAAPSALSYTTPNVYTVGSTITNLNPTVTGTVTSYSISPGLPTGLSFNTTTGVISGTPTVTSPATDYTVTATNGTGSTTAVVNITVNATLAAPTSLSYNTPNVYTTGTTITDLNPSVVGTVTSYSISTPLPTGLTFNTTTGVISGTPTVTSPATDYTVTATNATGSTTAVVRITVNAALVAPSALSYNTPNVYVVGTTITSLNPTVTGTVTGYTITPTLPSGLIINPITGVISGTPTVTSPATIYTVTASNGAGSTTADLSIRVNAAAPTGLTYQTPNVYKVGTAITSLDPSITGTVDSYALTTGTLPAGLSFSTVNGKITGTPTTVTSLTSFTVTATNVSGNTVSNTFTITVNPADPSGLTYPTPNTYIVGTAITSLDPTVTGTVTSYALTTGTLPAGLSFSTVNGKITGTPSAVTALTSFTVTATNVSGSTVSNTFTITVNSGLPTDTDGDGVSDAQEAIDGTNPNDGCSYNPASQIFANTTLTWKNTDCDGDGTNNGTDPQPLNYCVGGAGGNPPSIGSPSYVIFGANDCDNDGIPNSVECASGGPNCQDYDADGIPNFQDSDSDNDGIPDSIEKNIDSDGDGIPNYLDLDSDNDGILDRTEGSSDRDGDGTPNYLDLDSDGDTILDAWEATDSRRGVIDPNYDGRVDQNGAFVDSNKNGLADFLEANPAPIPDTDKDGTADFLDLDSDGDTLLDRNELTSDPDKDGIPNYRDLDSDGDWLGDSDERDSDNDGDGIPNYLDLDSDGDTIPDAWEGKNKCATCTNLNDGNGDGWDDRGQYVPVIDTDKDGTSDFLDLDSDNDCIPDRVELGDDLDLDGKANFRDTDSDNDGILDALEAVTCNTPVDTDKDGLKDFEDVDSDNDGISDKIEAGSDPSNPVDTDKDGTPDFRDLDSDNDGIPDKLEAGADPSNPVDTDKDGTPDFRDLDSDNDGISDKVEAGADPNNPVDTDKDGTPDYRDLDSDNDGIPDKLEAGSDPNNPVDTDKDGTPDFRDLDSDNDGIPDKIEAGADPNNPLDTDKDGTPDFQDLDSDNDGIPDKVEAGADPNNPIDTDKDGTPDFRDTDSDNDGIPDLFEAGKDPNNPVDTDKDGTPDYRDLDSDNDGIPDSIEAGKDPINPVDTDKDGTPDFRDLDSDNDGIPDKVEAGKNPSNPTDTDKDGIPDFRELDSDNDTIPDKTEAGNNPNNPIDTDSDIAPDFQDLDTDNDGIPDKIEAGPNPNAPIDTDNDGTPDFRDLDSDNDGVMDKVEAGANPSAPLDTDKDGKPDFQDTDDDNDGILDVMEDNLDYGGLPDCDNDGIPNRLDPDICPSFIPQGISPNGDGKNDKLIIPGILGFKNTLTIFNRWGEIVYETKDYKNDWGGESNNVFILKDGLLPDGVYYYIVDFYGVKPNISTFIFINRLKVK
ncbi:putative Ig domain-containing protein [Aquirufa aurantiipilula]|uniref:Ig domain-containing protein n=1 Tax=Aquirufa aurantiipilula TaxID=2696561 RepID=A0ABT6BNB4_9BACT|nr:putative Ig domain-containing protein [Aquirufa aurantiipilula]MDF5691499.1 putative Ig domain-containing protein [Aquirufa aurantiipilula]